MSYTLAEIELGFAAQIAALSATPYQHGQTGEVWRESPIPLTAITNGSMSGHLAFSVSIESAPVLEAGHAAEYVSVIADIRAIFMYRLRPDSKQADYRSAQEAARDVMSAVLSTTWMRGGVAVTPTNVWQPGALVNEWLPVETRYTAIFDLSI